MPTGSFIPFHLRDKFRFSDRVLFVILFIKLEKSFLLQLSFQHFFYYFKKMFF
ncbi:hypothetical protein RV11_GL001572 [Enterococcus phoeniculicola]|nr:hypothetical protein RV11_GL001572 [Enterococcus phoeniculicola]